ncbi:MAG: Lrp/AsnC ligand binding domain-containing protein [Dehalococcoidia bacterium]|nr:Lrp/AsnC ligand binding domain-containing protein [Dehalococcoidia bacterium]
MSTKAYVLIETSVGKSGDVATALGVLPGVDTVDPVTGPYDIIAVVSANDLNAVGQIVTREIHTVPGIVRTVTCMVVGGP